MTVSADTPNIETMLIRDLVELHPDTMRILAPLGLDLCCGGGHPLGEALELHGLDRPAVLAEVRQLIASTTSEVV